MSEKKDVNQVIADLLYKSSTIMNEIKAQKKGRADEMEMTRGEIIELGTKHRTWCDAHCMILNYAEQELGLSESTVFAMSKGEWNGK